MLSALFLGWRSPLVEYVPVEMDNRQNLVASPVNVTPTHLDHLERVLSDYGQPHNRVSPTKLLISLRLRADQDLLWNFTTKANESEKLATPTAMP
ncbi:MAG: hypothetical protein JWO31_1876 [Phycisphaerales bacterium]|nr:hypothetical protein [Phycisphaerales bacterium]